MSSPSAARRGDPRASARSRRTTGSLPHNVRERKRRSFNEINMNTIEIALTVNMLHFINMHLRPCRTLLVQRRKLRLELLLLRDLDGLRLLAAKQNLNKHKLHLRNQRELHSHKRLTQTCNGNRGDVTHSSDSKTMNCTAPINGKHCPFPARWISLLWGMSWSS